MFILFLPPSVAVWILSQEQIQVEQDSVDVDIANDRRQDLGQFPEALHDQLSELVGASLAGATLEEEVDQGDKQLVGSACSTIRTTITLIVFGTISPSGSSINLESKRTVRRLLKRF